jgi:hypothetical protein
LLRGSEFFKEESSNLWMYNALQNLAFITIRKYYRCKSLPVDGTIWLWCYRLPEVGYNLLIAGGSRCHHLTSELICVDDQGSLVSKDGSDGAFAGAD